MSAPQRPAWLTEGSHVCPSWCIATHFSEDGYEAREHYSADTAIPLSADDFTPNEEKGATRPGAEGLPHINMNLIQHYREESPRIWVGKGGSERGFYVTLAEAEWLATELQDLVRNDEQSRRTLPEREERIERERDERARREGEGFVE